MTNYLEILAVIFSLIYLFFLMQEKITCWFFGIASSTISIYIFYSIGLYSESLLYIYYVVIGIYGYKLWSKKKNNNTLIIQKISNKKHLILLTIVSIVALLTGYLFDSNTRAVNPYLDAFTTVFSIITSYLEAKKVLSAWIFWIFINACTIILYLQQDLQYYLYLTVIYLIFSILGYLKWRKSFLKQTIINVESV